MTSVEYFSQARERFGDDQMNWAFICPVCKHRQTVRDYANAGAPETAIAFSCVGRWIAGSKDAFSETKHGPCNYAGGGLFRLNPVALSDRNESYFELADGGVR